MRGLGKLLESFRESGLWRATVFDTLSSSVMLVSQSSISRFDECLEYSIVIGSMNEEAKGGWKKDLSVRGVEEDHFMAMPLAFFVSRNG